MQSVSLLSFGACRVTLSQALHMTQTGSDWVPQHNKQWSLLKHNSTHYSLIPQCLVFRVHLNSLTPMVQHTNLMLSIRDKEDLKWFKLSYLKHEEIMSIRGNILFGQALCSSIFHLGFQMSGQFKRSSYWISLDIRYQLIVCLYQ